MIITTYEMSSEATTLWNPPQRVEDVYSTLKGSKFSKINTSTSGAQVTKELPTGRAQFQLYSLNTPNGLKVSIYLEELGVEYDAHKINIGESEQFTSGFVEVNPNSKIPVLVDNNGYEGEKTSIFESAAIVYYLAEKFGAFYPNSPKLRNEIRQWIFWQMSGQGPNMGNFAHFFRYAPQNLVEARNYGVARYGMETKRLCHVLETRLSGRTYVVGEEYTIADIVLFPWFFQTYTVELENGQTGCSLLSLGDYPNTIAWMNRILERPAVKRGIQVCSPAGEKPWISHQETSAK